MKKKRIFFNFLALFLTLSFFTNDAYSMKRVKAIDFGAYLASRTDAVAVPDVVSMGDVSVDVTAPDRAIRGDRDVIEILEGLLIDPSMFVSDEDYRTSVYEETRLEDLGLFWLELQAIISSPFAHLEDDILDGIEMFSKKGSLIFRTPGMMALLLKYVARDLGVDEMENVLCHLSFVNYGLSNCDLRGVVQTFVDRQDPEASIAVCKHLFENYKSISKVGRVGIFLNFV